MSTDINTSIIGCSRKTQFDLEPESLRLIATGEWLSIYTMEIGELAPFGKTTNKWSKNRSKWRRATISFNQTSKKCDTFLFDYDLTINNCGSGWAELRQGIAGEINLNGIPWDKVSADLKLLRTKTFDVSSVRYAWLGPECSFP
ncbi:hypothetical protein MAR_005446 [Mya arenaria]|uniref:Uncharacterized protein n=1 Tax=Mya arenaria TaxID=6604 RepID=A0ABY7F7S4_MYAAR|nr:hypothetical protein MAR_005446 [Mya arenaria]